MRVQTRPSHSSTLLEESSLHPSLPLASSLTPRLPHLMTLMTPTIPEVWHQSASTLSLAMMLVSDWLAVKEA